jgi:tetratricopeptide (TPR) repeat protein
MEKASFNIFIITIVLGIIAFTSPAFLPFAAVKTAVIGGGVIISFLLYLIHRLRSGTCDMSCNSITVTGGLLGLSVIVSTLLSLNPWYSFMGKGFGSVTGLYLLVILAAGYLAYALVRTRERMFTVYLSLIGSFVLIALFQIIRLITGPGFLSFGLFTAASTSPVGSWYDLGIFSGLIAIVSLLALNTKPISKRLKITLIVISVIALLYAILAGFTMIWIGLAIVALVYVVKKYLDNLADATRQTWLKKIPAISLALFVVAVLLIWKGYSITSPVVNTLHMQYAEVMLPWQYTLDVITPTVKGAPLFGIGPDHFVDAYNQFKPVDVNVSQFWNVPFTSGSSFVLSTFVTQGLVGFILWILLIIFVLRRGLRVLMTRTHDGLSMFTMTASVLGTVFLLSMLVLYTPSHVVMFLTFVFIGLLVRELVEVGEVKQIEHSWTGMKRIVLMVSLGIMLVLTVIAGAYLFKKVIGQRYIQAAITTLNSSTSTNIMVITQNADVAKNQLKQALRWNAADTTYQALASVDLYEANALAANATNTSDTALADQISKLITEGVAYARTAELMNPSNPDNYLMEASIGEAATSLRMQNGYEGARVAYLNALQLEPRNPSTYLSLAKLDYAVGSTTQALTDINAALQVKPNYTDALFEAGLISYYGKDYQSAESAFTRTIQIDPNYANAYYLLGLTFIRLGNKAQAQNVFTALDKAYPNNQQITYVLDALKADRSPFVDSQSPARSPDEVNISNGASSTVSKTGSKKK